MSCSDLSNHFELYQVCRGTVISKNETFEHLYVQVEHFEHSGRAVAVRLDYEEFRNDVIPDVDDIVEFERRGRYMYAAKIVARARKARWQQEGF